MPRSPSAPDEALRDLQRLAVVRWLGRTSPLPLDPGLLRLEEAALTAACRSWLDPDDDAAALDRAEVDWALGLSRAVRADPALPWRGRVVDLLTTLFAGILGSGDPDLPLEAVRREHDALRAEPPAPSGAALVAAVEAWLSTMAPDPLPGPADAPPLSGRATVDWDRVPRGLVDGREQAASWRIRARAEGGAMSVVVPSAPAAPRHPLAAGAADPGSHGRRAERLRFRLYVPGWPLPLTEGEIAPRDDTLAWSGAQPLSAEAMSRLGRAHPWAITLDIAAAGYPTAPKRGMTARVAEATRWSVRGLSGLRLLGAAQAHAAPRERGVVEAARRSCLTALATAGGRWADLSRDTPDELGLSLRSADRCRALGLAAGVVDDPGTGDGTARPGGPGPGSDGPVPARPGVRAHPGRVLARHLAPGPMAQAGAA